MPKVIKSKTNLSPRDKGLVSRHELIDKIMTLTTPIWDSKSKKLKPRMTIANACSEVWITSVTYHSWLKEDKVLAQMVEDVKNSHRQMMEDMASSIVLEWLNWDVKLRANEKIQLAKWFLEKTSPHFNPSQKIEMEASNSHIVMSEEEIINRLKELAQETWETLLIPNLPTNEPYPIADITETTTWDEEEISSTIEGNDWGTSS